MKKIISIILLILFAPKIFATDLVNIPRGEIDAIWMSPMSKKQKNQSEVVRIKLDTFRMMEHAVTVREFKDFLTHNPQWSKESSSELFKDHYYLKNLYMVKNESAPITYVTWFAARAYCEYYGLRLPTVNEWEYVSASSESLIDANKDPKFLERILEWYGEPQTEELKSVKSIYKNKYGIWDMHGLIWEWVDDFNSNFVTGESREDGSFNKDMFCGAGALSASDKENYAAFMRFAFRSSLKGKSAVWNLGFRCVKGVSK